MTSTDFLKLWGKTDRSSNADPNNYHPLLFHLYDVAFSAAELWDVLPAKLKSRMASALNMGTESAGTLFVLLAGLHDLGKAYPKFQFQESAKQLQSALDKAGFDFPGENKAYPHNFVSVPEVMRLIAEGRLFPQPLTPELARLFAYALGAHHGVFPHAGDIPASIPFTLGENPAWQEARNWLADQLKAALPYVETAAPPTSLVAVKDQAFAPLLAAFISLADWFGSSKHFEMKGAQDIAPYREVSKTSAATALQKSGWTPPPVPPTAADFAQLFAYLDTTSVIEPNALQKKVTELLEGVQTPALWMIEEEMGAGKTEAAFSIFDHARVHNFAHGTYIAMPTQATSNAMHTRLRDFLGKGRQERDLNLILAHSHAILDEGYRQRIETADQFQARVHDDEQGNEEEGVLRIREWFTHHKQTLLAHYGVGTIDQALLGVLQTRHWFVRLFGLAGKVVIFDEVHAYDAYMNTLLSRLIEWLAELDCTVVLLSATLPKTTRLKLAEAYTKGAKAQLEAPHNQAVYPRITLVRKGVAASARAVEIVKAPKPEPKRVALSHLPNTPEAVKSALLNAIPGDGCAIVICNTVANAQQMYEALNEHLRGEGWRCLLFHARTPFKWRRKREKLVLRLFGKRSGNRGTQPRKKNLLVATQVVEQSLDLDADFMASELAPVDLILQRMGRLWRHPRNHDARSAKTPCFALLYDTDEKTGLPDVASWKEIYAPHTLLRSWLALKDRAEIALPNDIEPLVSAVYDADDPTGLPDKWITKLNAVWTKLQNDIANQEKIAGEVIVKEPCAPRYLFNQPNRKLNEEDNPKVDMAIRAATRLTEPNVRVICIGKGKQHEPLAPNLEYPKTTEELRSLMEFEVNIASQGLVDAILKTPQPKGWKKKAHLRFHFPIYFESGVARIGRDNTITLELDEEFGLRERKNR